MMKRMGNFQKFVVGTALISASFLILVGCPDQYVVKKGEQAQRMAEQTSRDMDLKAGDLIVGWGTSTGRKLKMKELEDDLNNDLPGGGGKDADGKDIRVVMVTFYRSDGKAFVAKLNGDEMQPCAQVDNGKIKAIPGVPICPGLRGKELSISGIQKVTINTSHSPDCSVDVYCNYALQGPCR